jgi:hypothetical protein
MNCPNFYDVRCVYALGPYRLPSPLCFENQGWAPDQAQPQPIP